MPNAQLLPNGHARASGVASLPEAVSHRGMACSRWQLLAFGVVELSIVALIGSLFWYQDWRYSLPTPQPVNLQQPALRTVLAIPLNLKEILLEDDGRPVLLHFMNPDCPCSRFVLDHVRALQRQFAGQIRIVAVLEGSDADSLQQQFTRLQFPIKSIVDVDGSLAHMTGVYSTPQAVVLDHDQRLIYRGNYNTSRYCTAPQTEFVRIALENLLQNRDPASTFPAAATTAYGCPLPLCSRTEGAL